MYLIHFNPLNTTRDKYHSFNILLHFKWLESLMRKAQVYMSIRNLLDVQMKMQMFLYYSPWLPSSHCQVCPQRGSLPQF